MPRLFKNITHSFSWLAFNSPLQILMNKGLLARIPHEISKPTAASIVISDFSPSCETCAGRTTLK